MRRHALQHHHTHTLAHLAHSHTACASSRLPSVSLCIFPFLVMFHRFLLLLLQCERHRFHVASDFRRPNEIQYMVWSDRCALIRWRCGLTDRHRRHLLRSISEFGSASANRFGGRAMPFIECFEPVHVARKNKNCTKDFGSASVTACVVVKTMNNRRCDGELGHHKIFCKTHTHSHTHTFGMQMSHAREVKKYDRERSIWSLCVYSPAAWQQFYRRCVIAALSSVDIIAIAMCFVCQLSIFINGTILLFFFSFSVRHLYRVLFTDVQSRPPAIPAQMYTHVHSAYAHCERFREPISPDVDGLMLVIARLYREICYQIDKRPECRMEMTSLSKIATLEIDWSTLVATKLPRFIVCLAIEVRKMIILSDKWRIDGHRMRVRSGHLTTWTQSDSHSDKRGHGLWFEVCAVDAIVSCVASAGNHTHHEKMRSQTQFSLEHWLTPDHIFEKCQHSNIWLHTKPLTHIRYTHFHCYFKRFLSPARPPSCSAIVTLALP